LGFADKLAMKTLQIRFFAERALFRNLAMPGTDVADADMVSHTRAIHGLIGNMLGLWRDFDDTKDFGLAPPLIQWIAQNRLVIKRIDYPHDPEIRILFQHRYKDTANYTIAGESGPKGLTYHWQVQMNVVVELLEKGAEELIAAIRRPVGTPYLGQSNCPAQVLLVE
jgi:hypothetical protein